MLVHLNSTAKHAAIILKMGVPIPVAEHDKRSAVGAMLIGGVEETAKIRLNAQCVEVVPAGFIEPRAGWMIPRIQTCLFGVNRCQIIKAAVAIAQVEIIGIRLCRGIVAHMLKQVEAFRSRHLQRAQDHSV